MCRPLRELGRGANEMRCCATHSWGPGNQETADHSIQSIISSTDIKMKN